MMPSPPLAHGSKTKLLDAALQVIRSKGYSATTVDDVCAAAGVTKGSFFHHFKGKEELAIVATQHWTQVTGQLFASAPYQQVADPRERILAYIDFRAAILQGELPDFTCLLGTMVQETFQTHPAIRLACNVGINSHAQTLVSTIDAAKALYAPDADWTAESLASTPRPHCKALLFWPRHRAVPRLQLIAWRICAGMFGFFLRQPNHPPIHPMDSQMINLQNSESAKRNLL
jgi:TetR/AcrR family transcriptional regulator, transcriptional repressor for nem operon